MLLPHDLTATIPPCALIASRVLVRVAGGVVPLCSTSSCGLFSGWENKLSQWFWSSIHVLKSVQVDRLVRLVLMTESGVARSGVKGDLGIIWEVEGPFLMQVTIGPRVGRHALVMPIHSSTIDQVTEGRSAPDSVSFCGDLLEEDEG